MYTPLAYLNLFTYEALHNTVGPREPVTLARTLRRSASRHRADHRREHLRQLPGHQRAVRGAQQPQAGPSGVEIFNYGYAASIANCSADTNITLRYGGTAPTTCGSTARCRRSGSTRKRPACARCTSTPSTGGNLQNLMNDAEKKDIDEFVQFDQTSVRDRDMAAAAKLIELLNDDKPELVLINKVGAHFPVHDKYPDAFMAYRPTLPRGQFTEVADTGERNGFNGQPDDWVLYRNAYKNTCYGTSASSSRGCLPRPI
jgi:hypothetical protein